MHCLDTIIKRNEEKDLVIRPAEFERYCDLLRTIDPGTDNSKATESYRHDDLRR